MHEILSFMIVSEQKQPNNSFNLKVMQPVMRVWEASNLK